MVKLFVEGGGDSSALNAECRKGFTSFITKAGIDKRPRVVACGSRKNAYDSYCTAIKNGEDAVLLVDAESPVAAAHQQGLANIWLPWSHLKDRTGDQWEKPNGALETDCHLMVQLMESWFIADRNSLECFFGCDFKATKLPPAANEIEGIAKSEVYSSLKEATKLCLPKGEYGKGAHSFKILEIINPDLVMKASPWAKRFVDELKVKMSGR